MNVQTQIDNLIVNLQHLKTSIATLDGSDSTGFIKEFENSLAQLEQDFSLAKVPALNRKPRRRSTDRCSSDGSSSRVV